MSELLSGCSVILFPSLPAEPFFAENIYFFLFFFFFLFVFGVLIADMLTLM